jgi:hypothetical protein
MASKAWRVTLNGKGIDTVFQDGNKITADDVKRSLVNHDGYDSGIVVRRQYNCGKRPRPYVGLNSAAGVREVFKADETPTEAKTPQYKAVIGPFRTMRAARFMAEHGANNPHLVTVADAERIAAQPA